jgi:hypothetical protein
LAALTGVLRLLAGLLIALVLLSALIWIIHLVPFGLCGVERQLRGMIGDSTDATTCALFAFARLLSVRFFGIFRPPRR